MILLLLLLGAAAAVYSDDGLNLAETEKLTGSALANYLRSHQTLFEVRDTSAINEIKRRLMDARFSHSPEGIERKKADYNEELPERFDAREYWPNCTMIGYIRDQSACGSCWAVSAAAAMSDRLCIQSNSRIKVDLSDTDILSCCGSNCGLGCDGGYAEEARNYVMNTGVCSGGRYRQKSVCKPYAFHPCGNNPGDIYYGECPTNLWSTPRCQSHCQRGYYTPYKKDKHYVNSVYSIVNDEKEIRKEIMKNGPAQASFDCYEDFGLYSGGIYKHTAGEKDGGHSVKIIGWGTENGTDYWLIANSWGVNWGEEGGYFRIVRGQNDCNLENQIVAGMMRVD